MPHWTASCPLAKEMVPQRRSGPCAGQDHVTYHGYDYAIVEIGDQCWFAENARKHPTVSPVEFGQ